MADNSNSGKPRIKPGLSAKRAFKMHKELANAKILSIPKATTKAKIVPLPRGTKTAADSQSERQAFLKKQKTRKGARARKMLRRDI